MDMERSIPKSINYQDVLPVAVPAVARRRRFFPQGGASGFTSVGTSEIRIEIGSVNSLLDPQHSYIEMFVTNNNAAQQVGFDIGGGHVLFDEVRVEQAGRVIAREQEHNRLHAGILSSAQTNYDGQLTESIGQQQRGLNQIGGGVLNKRLPIPQGAGVNGDNYANLVHNDQTDLGAGASTRICMAMPTGLFTQDKLIPLPLVSQNNPITLVFVMTSSVNVGSWSAQPIGAGDIQIDRMNYVAQLIEVGGDVIGQMRMMQEMGGGQLTISSQDIEHSADVIPANSTGEIPIRIPARKKSIKSLLFQINSADFTQGAPGVDSTLFMNLSYGGNANMDNYQMKVGSVVYPPQPVNCWGNCARAAGALLPLPTQERGECAMELAKALGSLGFTNPTGRLSTLNYGTSTAAAIAAGAAPLADGDNGDGGGNTLTTTGDSIQSVCPFGLDLQAFQHTAIESGVDSETMAMETTLICNINAVASGIEDKNVHCYLIFDQHYYFNADGTITFSN
tara:strand:+ start:1546 stop:3063 length:1518 start_codon:yes stop_codon:yes gene_type:complete